jgi:hypothetical protein
VGEKFDQMRDKAQDALGQHGDKVEQGVDKGREFADKKTGGKYSDQMQRGADEIKERFGDRGQDQQNR